MAKCSSVLPDQYASKWVNGRINEIILPQFITSEDKATTSIIREPDSKQINDLLRSISYRQVRKLSVRLH